MPQSIVHDNGPQFIGHTFQRFYNMDRILSIAPMTYYSPANSLAEAFNKTIVNLLKKFSSQAKRDWNDKFIEFQWAYHIMVRTPIKVAPFSSVYGLEAVLPVEVQCHP